MSSRQRRNPPARLSTLDLWQSVGILAVPLNERDNDSLLGHLAASSPHWGVSVAGAVSTCRFSLNSHPDYPAGGKTAADVLVSPKKLCQSEFRGSNDYRCLDS
ncbi:hypothetical protein IF1G_09541 [Cordyceps javanica]|uniref:Uncharacterized protein n=1 Tax=Cordyceps javanica TaxID=43265 RepID=A0A545UR72_9HYPO|nr:hypothetical protein IF1G_09541 [Cordyceps javanica]